MRKETEMALEEAGIDVEDVLGRFMGNEKLLFRCMDKFLEDKNFAKLQDAITALDEEGALAASHTLKGVCGNLSMQRLSVLLEEQVKAFRAGEWEKAAGLLPQITQEHGNIVRAWEGAMGK